MYIYIYICICTCTYICIYIHVYVRTYILGAAGAAVAAPGACALRFAWSLFIYTYVYVCIYIYIYAYIYIYTHILGSTSGRAVRRVSVQPADLLLCLYAQSPYIHKQIHKHIHIYLYTYIYIYIYIHKVFAAADTCLRLHRRRYTPRRLGGTPSLPTYIVDFRGSDSSIILILRGGIFTSIGDSPESLSRAMLVGTILVRSVFIISNRKFSN